MILVGFNGGRVPSPLHQEDMIQSFGAMLCNSVGFVIATLLLRAALARSRPCQCVTAEPDVVSILLPDVRLFLHLLDITRLRSYLLDSRITMAIR